jgi:cytochrome c-type biogenesis protein CcmH/NrfG
VRRSLALIAVAAAVAAAAVVVVAGMSAGDGAGAATGQQADAGGTLPSPGATGALPSGHPSIAAPEAGDPTPAVTVSSSAIARLEDESSEDPGNMQVLLDLGNAYFMRQHLQQAEAAFSRALAQEPDSTAAQVGLAMVWHAQGDSKRAEKALTAVIETHPDDQDAHYSLAIVYFSGGHTDKARQEWETAARIDPASVTGRRSQSFVDLIDGNESAAPEAGN